MNTYELTKKYAPAFEVVENGPDATDYVVTTVKGENPARLKAAAYQARNGYLGYGYTIRPLTNSSESSILTSKGYSRRHKAGFFMSESALATARSPI